jgi:hypothetical protein
MTWTLVILYIYKNHLTWSTSANVALLQPSSHLIISKPNFSLIYLPKFHVLYIYNWRVLFEDGPKRIETCWTWSFSVLIVKLYITILCILLVFSYVIIVEIKLTSNQTSSIFYKTARRTENWNTTQNIGIIKQRMLVCVWSKIGDSKGVYLFIYLGVKLESSTEWRPKESTKTEGNH